MAETIPMNKWISEGREEISIDVEIGDVGATREEPPPKKFPIFITLVSLLQMVFFCDRGDYLFLYFGYDPYRRHELWRYFTIMLVHGSSIHLWGNIVLQVILGGILERRHHWTRISIIYICGVLGGSLAVTVFDPQSYSVGASAGIYALLTAHLATLILNWNEMEQKCCRLFWLLLFIFCEAGFALYVELVMKIATNVSHAAHCGGAVVGFIVALLVLRNSKKHPLERRLQVILGILIAVLFAVVVVINVAWPSHYKKTEWNMSYRKTFLHHVLQMMARSNPRQPCVQDETCRFLIGELSRLT